MRAILLTLVLFSDRLAKSQQECSRFSTCEACAGVTDNGISCRWCLETLNECVPSKYMCHPWKTVMHTVNCPLELPKSYNDSFNRNEVAAYIQAANRVSEFSPVGAPMSCLLKIGGNVQVLFEMDVPTTIERSTIGVLIGVNHDLKHIFVGFRSTNNGLQLLAQFFVFMMGWMEDFPLGGRMVAIYVQIYKDILNFGFDKNLETAVSRFPSYPLLFTGHSLGGAMSTVFSLHVALKYPQKRITLYSWEGPRSGDETFVKMLREHLYEEFRIVRDGDFVPDFPLRISHTLDTPHHNSFEVFYESHTSPENYRICSQPETESCLKGSWWKKPVSHLFLFDQNFWNYKLGYCD